MESFDREIIKTLESNGVSYRLSEGEILSIVCFCAKSGKPRRIIPVGISARSPREAERAQKSYIQEIQKLALEDGEYPLVVSLDRWMLRNPMMRARMLAHLEIHSSVFARDCSVRRIDRTVAREFLEANHSYGYASGKYHYGIFVDRSRGGAPEQGTLIAAATFSPARKWLKGGREIRSYEWTRYSSLPSLRVSGGMGKVLKAFIRDRQPDDIMSYADLEWSEGTVYEQLGFTCEGLKTPVLFTIDPASWTRKPIAGTILETSASDIVPKTAAPGNTLWFINFGSRKYRLKLTQY
ncbi:MAG: hypothetical protein ACI395_04035 [Candidatus Cryptobacteroides sp.]